MQWRCTALSRGPVTQLPLVFGLLVANLFEKLLQLLELATQSRTIDLLTKAHRRLFGLLLLFLLWSRWGRRLTWLLGRLLWAFLARLL